MKTASDKNDTSLLPLMERMGYRFSDPTLLQMALTHSSFMKEQRDRGISCPCNERLEFLGDSVLSLIASTHLYAEHPDIPEGDLSSIRAGIVDEDALPRYAKELSLGEFLRLGHGVHVTHKLLENAFEALVGAIYLDGGFSAARAFALPFLQKGMQLFLQNGTTQDPKTMLQQIVQQEPGNQLCYAEVSRTGPDHCLTFTMEVLLNGTRLGIGTASSKKKAEQLAAKDALTYFGI